MKKTVLFLSLLYSFSVASAQSLTDSHLSLDSCRAMTKTTDVNAGKAPLTQAYLGDGVIVGVIDGGMQYDHPTYLDENGNLRFRKVWDFDENGNPIVLTDPQAILARKCSYGSRYGYATTNHAAHVAAIAAGSGRHKGMAPAADILFADFVIPMSKDSLLEIYQRQLIKNIRDMQAYADSVNKPIVINISLAQNIGFSTELAAMQKEFESLTGPGHIIVAAAGNEGNMEEQIHYLNGGTNTSTTFNVKIMPAPMANKVYVRSADSIELIPVIPDDYKQMYQTSYVRLPDAPDGKRVYRLNISPKGMPAMMPFQVEIQVKGNATFEIYTTLCGIENSLASGCTVSNAYTVAIPASYPNVIAAANYAVNDGKMEMAPSSCWGPTWDGRNKPDVTAIGSVISAGNYYYAMNSSDVTEAYTYAGVDSLETWCAQYGTSQASPMTAGIIALWLQANPKLTPEDILAVIKKTAKPLEEIPNNKSGAGLIDAYAGLLEVLQLPQAIEELSVSQPQNVRFVLEGQTLHALGAEQGTIRIYDLKGQLVAHGQLQDERFTLPGLNTGVYAVQLNTNNAQTTGSTLIRIK